MPIKVLELHHHGIRIGTTPGQVETSRRFYTEVLGLTADSERPDLPGVPGFWMFVGNDKHTASIHLMGATGISPLARNLKEDPTLPHVALAVEDIQAATEELKDRGIWFWQIQGLVGADSDQVFVQDPSGNVIELHQIGTCRCNKASFAGSGFADDRTANAIRIAEAIRLFGDYRWVGLYDVRVKDVSIIAWSGPGAPAYPVFPVTSGLTGRSVASKQTVVSNDVANDPGYLTAFGSTRSEIIVPVMDGGAVVGTIDVESERKDAFTDRDRLFLEHCAAASLSIWK